MGAGPATCVVVLGHASCRDLSLRCPQAVSWHGTARPPRGTDRHPALRSDSSLFLLHLPSLTLEKNCINIFSSRVSSSHRLFVTCRVQNKLPVSVGELPDWNQQETEEGSKVPDGNVGGHWLWRIRGEVQPQARGDSGSPGEGAEDSQVPGI